MGEVAMLISRICLGGLLVSLAGASSLTKPPQSALIIGFEKPYEQSLLAYTLSDQAIDTALMVTSSGMRELYEKLEGIEIIELNVSDDTDADKVALAACETLLGDKKILERVREIQPTFVLFPALRHDACLLPWVEFISSIPVIVTYGPEEDLYAVQRTGMALPMHTGELWSGFWANADSRSLIAYADRSYVTPASRLAKQHLAGLESSFDKLYAKVELIFNVANPILRTNFALLGDQPVDISCHHCRGAHPLPSDLQKQLVEFRLGTIAVTLDESFVSLVSEIARKLPQGRQGQAVAWKSRKVQLDDENRPENLFVHGDVDRQDLVGYARARVLLSHCGDVELLEAAFHGTPVICFPRNFEERNNARRAIALGFSVADDGDAVHAAIERVHKTASYREVARGVSTLIRDRPLPPSDRLVYWLEHAARGLDRPIRLAALRASAVRTYAEDSQLLSGLIVGIVVGAALTVAGLLAWFNVKNSHKPGNRKDRKFNR